MRTDIHRPSTIEPEKYTYLFSYALPSTLDGWGVPGVNLDLLNALRESGARWARDINSRGTCSICGARFLYGDVWRHDNGEHVHVGHDCAEKYQLIADRRDYERELDANRVRSAREHERAMRAEQRAAFLRQHDGLEAALGLQHHILADLAEKLNRYGDLSDRQVALALKIAREITERANRPAETHVPAPEGRVTFEGVIVATKWHESDYGSTLKCTIKVQAEGGCWLAWGTVPGSLFEATQDQALRGARVRLTATLTRGRDAHFALYKRPSKAEVLEYAPAAA